MIILPAIDLKGGRCVRLRQGRFDQETVFDEDPVAVAKRFAAVFEAACLSADRRWLHVVDLDGAREGRPVHLEAVRAIAAAVPGTQVELGGGIRTSPDAERAFDAGMRRVVVGTQAFRDPDWFKRLVRQFPGNVALSQDVRRGEGAPAKTGLHGPHVAGGSVIAASSYWGGWAEPTGRSVADDLADFIGLPLGAIIYTEIARDGMMSGPDIAGATELVRQWASIPVIASGGVTTVQDVRRLREAGCAGVIIGRALYEGTLKLEDALAEAARP